MTNGHPDAPMPECARPVVELAEHHVFSGATAYQPRHRHNRF